MRRVAWRFLRGIVMRSPPPAPIWWSPHIPINVCLIYPAEAWEPIRDKVLAGASLERSSALLKRLLVGFARDERLDGAGRVLVAPELRRFAELEKSVWLVGQGTHFELWSDAGWQKQQELMFGMAADLLAARSREIWRCERRQPNISPSCSKKRSTRSRCVPDGVYVDGTFGRGGHSRASTRAPGARRAADRLRSRSGGDRGRCRRSTTPASSWCMRRSANSKRRWCALGIAACRRRFAGSRGVVAATGRRRARHELSLRCAAGHAHGYEPRADRGGVAGRAPKSAKSRR